MGMVHRSYRTLKDYEYVPLPNNNNPLIIIMIIMEFKLGI